MAARCSASRPRGICSLNCLSLKGVSERDLSHFVNAAHLLLQDGCDALDALQWRLDA
ncbi:hypothetical protein C4K38_0670 [Pseudomonas chlororaphis subsp. piscium]|nr:hypothetical protein C4K38_0670 [Pseudomonas chlororaphis subsp. piscium]